MGDHHRNSIAPRIDQDLTLSKSLYYYILRKNIDNQSEGAPLPWKHEGEKN